jgi:hypothetical protein
MISDLNDNKNPNEVEGDMIRMRDICRDRNDEDHEFSTEEMVSARSSGGGGRQAYTADGYRTSIIPILKKWEFIKMISEDKFKLTNKGKDYCKRLKIV